MRVAIVNDTRPTSHYGCLMVMKNLEILLQREGADILWTWPVGLDWRKHQAKIEAMPKVDAIIVNGEGTIHHGPKRWQAQALVEFADYAHQTLKVPAFLINATLFANDDALYNSLRQFDQVFVRDRASFDTLESYEIACTFVPDMTFAVSTDIEYKPQKPMCVIDSVMQTDVPFLKKMSQRYQADYRSMIVARPSNYSFWKRPRRFIMSCCKWAYTDRHFSLDPSSFEAYLAQYQFVITGRYHTVTMCLKNHIPFVALESNTPKIRFLLKEVFGSTRRMMDVHALNKINILEWQSFSDTEHAAIDVFLTNAKKANQQMIESIVCTVKDNVL